MIAIELLIQSQRALKTSTARYKMLSIEAMDISTHKGLHSSYEKK